MSIQTMGLAICRNPDCKHYGEKNLTEFNACIFCECIAITRPPTVEVLPSYYAGQSPAAAQARLKRAGQRSRIVNRRGP